MTSKMGRSLQVAWQRLEQAAVAEGWPRLSCLADSFQSYLLPELNKMQTTRAAFQVRGKPLGVCSVHVWVCSEAGSHVS